MGLRAKLSVVFVLLLVLAIAASSVLYIDYSTRLMVDELDSSGKLLIKQTFEQMRATLGEARGDRVKALQESSGLRTLLESTGAFGKGVVYTSIETPEGSPILSFPPRTSTIDISALPFEALQAETASRMPLRATWAIWDNHTFEMKRQVAVNGEPFAVIRLGISTALVSAEVHRSVRATFAFGITTIVLSLVGAFFVYGRLLRPVAALATSVEELVANGDTRTFAVRAHDELGTLAVKFNQLSQRIKSDRNKWETERRQFFNVFRSITDAVLLLDAGGGILFANNEAHGRLGLPAGGLSDGKPLKLVLGKEHPLARLVDSAYATGTEVHDVAIQLGSGEAPRLLVSILSLGSTPEPVGLLVIARDLESVKELENVVDYSGRLARLGALFSGIGHQIRNPLNALNLQLELISSDFQRGVSIDRRVSSMRNEIRRLEQAVDALVRMMRPERLELQPLNANSLLRDIASKVACPPEVRVKYKLEAGDACVMVDRALVTEGLTNIINNAIESMPAGGTLTLASNRTTGGFVEYRMTDEGTGISPENTDRIFELYFTTKSGGSGLGLSLALRAIDLHGGTLDVDSGVGIGTTVTIRLPAAEDTVALLPSKLATG